MTTSADLGIPYIAAQQAQPEVTHNSALNMLQGLLSGVLSRGGNTPPGAPAEGDSYIVGATPTGAWSGQANKIAVRFGTAWVFIPGRDSDGASIAIGARHEGLTVYVRDEDRHYVWSGSAWLPLLESTPLPRFLVTKGGSDQTVATGGAVDVTWGTEVFDIGSKFAASAWTPGRVGAVAFDLQIEFTDWVDNSGVDIILRRNASDYLIARKALPGTVAQGVNVSFLAEVASASDTFSIRVEHATGGDRTISGDALRTWWGGRCLP